MIIQKRSKIIIRKINIFAFSAATFMAIGTPMIYFFDDYLGEVNEVKSMAAKHASKINLAISDDAEILPSQIQQLIIGTNEFYVDDEDETAISILNTEKKVVTWVLKQNLSSWTIIEDLPLFKDKQVMNRPEFLRGLRASRSTAFHN